MFHTERRREEEKREEQRRVVIPWRGFRCFTLAIEKMAKDYLEKGTVVIPWRGFRCFTPTDCAVAPR